ncbi:MAG: bacterioferritin [Pseudomonadales bacterium]
MKGDPRTIDYLNQVLGNELVAINQYFLHARMLKDWGLDGLAHHAHAESLDEMRHADALIQRILFLEGLPNLQELGRLRVGEDAREILRSDLGLELDAMSVLREAVNHCEQQKDFVSRELFEQILEGEEEHVDWLETQLELVEKVGLENYLQSQMHAPV